MTIYMLSYPRFTGVDRWGDDEYDDLIDETLGYFTSVEDAQAWIDKRVEKARKDHSKFVRQAEQRVREWEAENAQHEAEMAEIVRLAADKGIQVKATGPRRVKPGIPEFVPPAWDIVPIEQAR